MPWPLLPLILISGPPPADCRAPATVGSIPLELSIAGQPGVPSNASGNIYMQLPVPASNALACDDATPPPADVLGGPPARDLLDGPGLTPPPILEIPERSR